MSEKMPEKNAEITPLRDFDRRKKIPSPNFDARPAGMAVELLVMHFISLPPRQYGGNGIIELFTNQINPEEHPFYADIAHLRVSAHFLIRRTGELIEFVDPRHRAFHAGESCFRGRRACNDFSIGVEFEGCGEEPFCEAQYQSFALLVQALKRDFPSLHSITGHEHIAPGRKQDPGEFFDWARVLADSGLAFWTPDMGD